MIELPPLDCEIEGYAWVPRMLAKARLTLAGERDGFVFGCPVDHTCMARLGISPDLVLELAGRHAEDRDVLAALREHGIPPAAEAWFDAPAVEDELQRDDLYLRVRDARGAFEGADHGAEASVVFVAGAREDWHSHPVAEIVAVTSGAATYSLGERQMRTLRAGEVARIPAGVAHRWVASEGEPFRAVAVFGAPRVETRHNGPQ